MFRQDWEPVVLRKKKDEEVKRGPTFTTQRVEQNRESFEHKTVPKNLADRIQKRRLELKMTQAQLAQKINEKPAVVNDVESMKCVYNHTHVNKILKALGITLREK